MAKGGKGQGFPLGIPNERAGWKEAACEHRANPRMALGVPEDTDNERRHMTDREGCRVTPAGPGVRGDCSIHQGSGRLLGSSGPLLSLPHLRGVRAPRSPHRLCHPRALTAVRARCSALVPISALSQAPALGKVTAGIQTAKQIAVLLSPVPLTSCHLSKEKRAGNHLQSSGSFKVETRTWEDHKFTRKCAGNAVQTQLCPRSLPCIPLPLCPPLGTPLTG